jgi:hypothetical protein
MYMLFIAPEFLVKYKVHILSTAVADHVDRFTSFGRQLWYEQEESPAREDWIRVYGINSYDLEKML